MPSKNDCDYREMIEKCHQEVTTTMTMTNDSEMIVTCHQKKLLL